MRPIGSADELERRRRQAVRSLKDGCKVAEVAKVMGVTRRSVERWRDAERRRGAKGLAARPAPGAKPKLNGHQERQVLGWFRRPATCFGFPTELWTAPRVAAVIQRKFKVTYHPRYLNAWLKQRGITPQKPERQARERNARKVGAWRGQTWKRLRREAQEKKPRSCSSTKAA